ncbi:ArnT family glycosyltransferase [Arenimonas sp. MALMAid1274]|uniref:ArnT family glycosyltransferase n=1 Tax=Arenimonas sp. MALMAid1274 TaxID=3411630 RepID=UPI003BA1435C
MLSSRILKPLLPLLLFCGALLVYLPGLGGGFLFDDYANIVTNPHIQMETLDGESLARAARAYEPGAYGRPLATISFAIDHYFGGKNPLAYKLSSLAVHLLNTFLVFWLVQRLLSLPRAQVAGAWHPWAAMAIAGFWAVHPLQVSTVLYVVQRMETLVTLFMLLGLLAYTRGRVNQIRGATGWPWLALAALSGAVGMLAKESAILLPLFTLALELTLLRFEGNSARFSQRLKWVYGVGAAIALVLFFGWLVPRYATPDSFDGRGFSMGERLLSQLRILPMYLGQMLLPLPGSLTFYYDDFAKSTGLFSPWTTAAGAVVLLALLVSAWRLRDRLPLYSLGVMWFFASHALTSNVLNLELIFEHRNYFALLGFLLAGADLVRRIPMRDGPALKIFGVAVVLVLFGVLGAIRSATWGNPLLLATDLVAKNPDSPRASNDLATIYVDMADGNPDSPFYGMGAEEFKRSSRLPNASPLPEQGLLLMAATMGAEADPAWWDSLIAKVRTQPLGPEQLLAVNGLMEQYHNDLPLDPARLGEAYLALLERAKWPGHMYASFGDFVLNELDDEELADRMFVQAVSVDPADDQFAALVLANLIAEDRPRQAAAVRLRMKELGHIKP